MQSNDSHRTSDLGSRTVTWELLQKSHKLQRGQTMEHVLRELELAARERQSIEDTRSVRRNNNRILMHGVTFLTSLILPALLGMTHTGQMILFSGVKVKDYSFVIPWVPDVFLTVLARVRRY